MSVRTFRSLAAALFLAVVACAATLTGIAAADTPIEGDTVAWFPSRVTASGSTTKHKLCFSGKVQDEAGYDEDFDIPGTIWENSMGRWVVLQRKSGDTWKKIKSVYANDDRTGRNYRICTTKHSGAYRVHITKNYYPYNTLTVRVHSASSKTSKSTSN